MWVIEAESKAAIQNIRQHLTEIRRIKKKLDTRGNKHLVEGTRYQRMESHEEVSAIICTLFLYKKCTKS